MYKINARQSFGYQIMLILMNEHYLSRIFLNSIGDSIGNDLFIIDISTIESQDYFTSVIYNNVSNHYKKHIEENIENFEEFEKFVIGLITNIDNNYCELKKSKHEKELTFQMNQNGYRYQFNGYIQKEQRLQETANLIALILAYLGSLNWLIKNGYVKLETDIEYLIPITFLIILTYIFRHKDWWLKLLFIFAILGLIMS